MESPILPNLQLPSFTPNDVTIDPVNHMHSFKTHLVFHRAMDMVKCMAFVMSLEENV